MVESHSLRVHIPLITQSSFSTISLEFNVLVIISSSSSPSRISSFCLNNFDEYRTLRKVFNRI